MSGRPARPAGSRRSGAARCVVTAVTRPTPRMARLQIAGEELVGVAPTGPDQRVKVAFPDGRRFGDDPAELSRSRRRRRTYTLLDLDPETGTAAIEFVLHGGGLAGEWAAQAGAGDELAVTPPVGRFAYDPGVDETLLVCDETGVPALRAIVAGLPEGASARTFVEVADAAERVDLPTRARLETTWLLRDETDATPGEPMTALADGRLSVTPRAQVWIAGESEAVRRLRTDLVTRGGLDRHAVTAVAYWQRGRAEGDAAAGRPGEH